MVELIGFLPRVIESKTEMNLDTADRRNGGEDIMQLGLDTHVHVHIF